MEHLEDRLAPATLAPGDLLVLETHYFGPGAEGGNGALVYVDVETGDQSVIAFDGFLVEPRDVDIDSAGFIYVAEEIGLSGTGGVVIIDPRDGSQTLFASGGNLFSPQGIDVAPNGDIFVATYAPQQTDRGVIKIDPQTGAQTIVSTGGHFDGPWQLVVDEANNIFVGDRLARAIIRIDGATSQQSILSSGGSFSLPGSIDFLAGGNLVVGDRDAFRGQTNCTEGGAVFEVNINDGTQSVISQCPGFFNPDGLATSNGDLFVSDRDAFTGNGGGIIQVDLSDGSKTTITSEGNLGDPGGMAVVGKYPPVADPGGPYVLDEGTSISLNASASFDVNQTTASLIFQWDLDNDGVFGETGHDANNGDETGATPVFSAATIDGPATVIVHLRVTDDDGLSSEASVDVQVENVPPVITTCVDVTLNEGDTLSCSGSFSDPAERDQFVQWKVEDGGNGHYYGLVLPDGVEDSFSWTGAKTAAENTQFRGTNGHLVTVTSSEENAFLEEHFRNQIGDPPYAWIGLTDNEAFGGTEAGSNSNGGWVWVTGESYSYSNWHFTEPNNIGDEDFVHYWVRNDLFSWNDDDNDIFGCCEVLGYFVEFEGQLDSLFTATVDYGDGGGPVQLLLNEDNTFDLEHTYEDEGVYTVTVTVKDDDGGESSESFQVTANPVAPTAVVEVDAEITVWGSAHLELGSLLDPSEADLAAGLRFEFSCSGEALGEVDYDSAQLTASVHCIFRSSGINTVSARLIDKDNAFTEYTADVNVLSKSESLVSAAFIDILGRRPEGDGLGFWSGFMDQGGTQVQLIQAIWNSREHRGMQVDKHFGHFLGRSPDSNGREFWIDSLVAGTGEDELIRLLITSAEYNSRYANAGAFADALYVDLLERTAAPQERTSWINAQNNGLSRQGMVEFFLGSSERILLRVDCFFELYLDRFPEPSAQDAFLNAYRNGLPVADLAQIILDSGEYQGLAYRRFPRAASSPCV